MLAGYAYPPGDDYEPPAPKAPPTVLFIAPCPGCRNDVEWRQQISGSAVLVEHFAIACDCNVAQLEGTSNVNTP